MTIESITYIMVCVLIIMLMVMTIIVFSKLMKSLKDSSIISDMGVVHVMDGDDGPLLGFELPKSVSAETVADMKKLIFEIKDERKNK